MDSHFLTQDVGEPSEMLTLLKQSIPAITGPLNVNGRADYYWADIQSNRRQWERKQIGEALSDLDSVEEQLNRYLKTCDELTWAIEGVALPTADGVQVFRHHEQGEFCRLHKTVIEHWCYGHEFRKQPHLWARFEGLKASIRKCGVEVVQTFDIHTTATALVAAFKSSMKEEHTTLRRYLRPHIPAFDPDIHVDNLCRLKGARVGPVSAQKLVAELGTFHAAVTAPKWKLINVLGRKPAYTFLEAIGRVE